MFRWAPGFQNLPINTNDLTIIAALAGVEMGLELAGISHQKGGVQVAMDHFASAANGSIKAAAE
jgi:alanine-glyoxylate transaminase/serine-glyoxylate transaminase/serine-pyruvate transaminase